MIARTFVTAALFAVALASQAVLQTSFATNNGGSPGGSLFFDLATGPAEVRITHLDLAFGNAAGTAGTVDLYTVPMTHIGREAAPSLWTLHDTVVIPSTAGEGMPSPGTFLNNSELVIPANTSIGIALICDSTLRHSYVAFGESPVEGCSLTLTGGAAANTPFGGAPFLWRIVATNLYYTAANVTCASAYAYGTGCTNTVPFALSPDNRPVIGNLPNPTGVTASHIQPTDTGISMVLGVNCVPAAHLHELAEQLHGLLWHGLLHLGSGPAHACAIVLLPAPVDALPQCDQPGPGSDHPGFDRRWGQRKHSLEQRGQARDRQRLTVSPPGVGSRQPARPATQRQITWDVQRVAMPVRKAFSTSRALPSR